MTDWRNLLTEARPYAVLFVDREIARGTWTREFAEQKWASDGFFGNMTDSMARKIADEAFRRRLSVADVARGLGLGVSAAIEEAVEQHGRRAAA